MDIFSNNLLSLMHCHHRIRSNQKPLDETSLDRIPAERNQHYRSIIACFWRLLLPHPVATHGISTHPVANLHAEGSNRFL
jgi:hypothetical protein